MCRYNCTINGVAGSEEWVYHLVDIAPLPSVDDLSVYTLSSKGIPVPSVLTLRCWDAFTLGDQSFALIHSQV